jgi:hypothetical protein
MNYTLPVSLEFYGRSRLLITPGMNCRSDADRRRFQPAGTNPPVSTRRFQTGGWYSKQAKACWGTPP